MTPLGTSVSVGEGLKWIGQNVKYLVAQYDDVPTLKCRLLRLAYDTFIEALTWRMGSIHASRPIENWVILGVTGAARAADKELGTKFGSAFF